MVAAALAGLAAGGSSILVAEQKTDLLAAICTRVVVVDAGRIVLDGPAAEVLGDPRLDELGVAPPAAVRLRRASGGADLPATTLERLHRALGEAETR
jgi:energy-coupling factor transporter ATP-binding protein EcfA2